MSSTEQGGADRNNRGRRERRWEHFQS